MVESRAALGQFLFVIASLALSVGCSSSSDASTDVDADAKASTDALADGACGVFEGCCCQGDVVAQPICTETGFVCPGGYQTYSAAQCAEPCGPCELPCHGDTGVVDTGVAETPGGDASCTSSDAGDACCCDGDVTQPVSCVDGGAPSCTAPYRLFFGEDCTRPCGPCTYAPSCIDSGVDGG